jgi:hypothetical protein
VVAWIQQATLADLDTHTIQFGATRATQVLYEVTAIANYDLDVAAGE